MWQRLLTVLALAAALVLPLTGNKHLLGLAIVIGLHGIVALGLSLLMGYGGQISLAQAAFYGIGAYTSGILSARFGISPWLGILAGMVLAGLVAWVVGIPTLRLKEQYLALATAGIGIIFFILFTELSTLTGGPSGLSGIPYLGFGRAFLFKTDQRFYYLVLAVAALAFAAARAIVHSRVGRALRAIHGSEVAAEAMGVDTAALKRQIFILSAVYASVAGSLYAHYVTFISPVLFSFHEGIHFAMMTVIGGVTSIWGSLLGAAVMTLLTDVLRSVVPTLIPGAGGEVETVFFGLLLIVLMIYMPRGMLAGPGRLWQGVSRRGAAGGA